MSDRAVIGLLCGTAAVVAVVMVLVLPSFLAPPPQVLLEGEYDRRVVTPVPSFRMPATALKEPEVRPARPFRPTPASAQVRPSEVQDGSSFFDGGMSPAHVAFEIGSV
jgi:hypothetical protein